MAREPIPFQPDAIPFAESAPADDLQVESFGEDEVLIGDPSLDFVDEISTAFDSNLAEIIDEKELDNIGVIAFSPVIKILAFLANLISPVTTSVSGKSFII